MSNDYPVLQIYAHKGVLISPVYVYDPENGSHHCSEVVDRVMLLDQAGLVKLFQRRRTDPVQVVRNYKPQNMITTLIGIPDLALALSKTAQITMAWYQPLSQIEFIWSGPINIKTGKYKSKREILPIDTPDSYFIDRIYEVVEKFKKEIN